MTAIAGGPPPPPAPCYTTSRHSTLRGDAWRSDSGAVALRRVQVEPLGLGIPAPP
jgi:hypothetical protein